MTRFEYVILDEAGAMLEPDVVGTLIHGCKFLLSVGDHLQLAPFTTWRNARNYQYDTSMLQRHATSSHLPSNHNLLTEQYRMPPTLATLVSDLFYGGVLTTAASTTASRQRSPAVRFVDVSGQEENLKKSYKNMAEVRVVVDTVRRERAAHPDQLINVIAFYKPQMFAIKDALKDERLYSNSGAALATELDVNTVDSMQGREADIGLCPHAYSSAGSPRPSMALAITRRCCIVGETSSTLQRCLAKGMATLVKVHHHAVLMVGILLAITVIGSVTAT
jgi:regulator of nonsense transcripts 1